MRGDDLDAFLFEKKLLETSRACLGPSVLVGKAGHGGNDVNVGEQAEL